MQENGLKASLRVDQGDLKASAEAIQQHICNNASTPTFLQEAIAMKLATPTFTERFVAVRSSGTDEDSSSHSFAGECSVQWDFVSSVLYGCLHKLNSV